MKNGIVAAILVALFAVAAHADEGRMSSSKLNQLGLGSLDVASDADGMAVRGSGRTFASGAFMTTAGLSSSGVLGYSFSQHPRPNATSQGQGFAVAEYSQVFNGVTFLFSAQAFGNSFAFAP